MTGAKFVRIEPTAPDHHESALFVRVFNKHLPKLLNLCVPIFERVLFTEFGVKQRCGIGEAVCGVCHALPHGVASAWVARYEWP